MDHKQSTMKSAYMAIDSVSRFTAHAIGKPEDQFSDVFACRIARNTPGNCCDVNNRLHNNAASSDQFD